MIYVDQWELWRQEFTEYKRRMRRILVRFAKSDSSEEALVVRILLQIPHTSSHKFVLER